MKLEAHYEIQKATIINRRNGTEFLFSGLRDAASLKSFESIDICWVEEAQAVTEESWDILIPTIRADNSEIWVVFNPRYEIDPTYKKFVIDVPPDCRRVKVNYYDNPWFPDVLRDEMEHLKEKAYSQYLHVCEGACLIAPEGAVYNLEWFSRYNKIPEREDVTSVIHSWDTAYKAGTHNDPSVCQVWYVTPSLFYLAETYRGKWEYPELRKRAFDLANLQKPDVILIEDKASGQSLIQEFQKGTSHPVIPIKPEGDKETRARTTAAMVEAGKITIPHSAHWLGDFETEIMLFPSEVEGVHDDQVDALSQFLRYMRDNNDGDFMAMMDRLYG